MVNRFTSRTGQSQFQRCPRSAWWGQFYEGRGLQVERQPFAINVGVLVHKGLELLLKGWLMEDVIEAVKEESVRGKVAASLVGAGVFEQQVLEEQTDLVEGLVRAWDLFRKPSLLEVYDVVEVEVDRASELTPGVVMEFKPDALLRDKQTGLFYILSNKTTGGLDYRKTNDAKTDVQGLSEMWGLEKELGIKINGVVMEYLTTGRTELEIKDNGEKEFICWSPLVRGWFNPQMPQAMQFAWRYDWFDENEKKHRLPKGYTRVKARDIEGGVKAWVEDLHKGEFFPGSGEGYVTSPLGGLFSSMEYYRNPEDLKDWEESIVYQEQRISGGLAELEVFKNDPLLLNKHFPKFRHSCNYPLKCQFYQLCWSSEGLDPGMHGFVPREPHHRLERERVEGLDESR